MSDLDKAWIKQKREGDPLSIRVMIEKFLESRSTGMKSVEIAKELEKAGHRSRAKDQVASVNTVMYRNRPKVFVRGKDGRWTLARLAEKPESQSHLQLVRKIDGNEA